MTAIFGTESYEGGAVGDAITAANTGHSSVGAGWTFANTPAPPVGLGVQSARVDAAAGVASYAQASFAATPIAVPRMYVRFPAVPATGSVDLASARGGGSLRARLGIVDGKFVLRNGATIVWTSTTAVPVQSWCRLEWFLNDDTGEQRLRIFRLGNHHGTVADEDSGARTLTAGAPLDIVRFGAVNNSLTAAWTAFYDGTIISDVTWPGPAYTPNTGGGGAGGTFAVDAGLDQLGVEPWSTVTLTATETGDGLTGHGWSQLLGTPVVLAGADTTTATFEAPATLQGDALQFQFSASFADPDTAASIATVVDVVDVTVRAVAERAVVGGKEVPLRIVPATAPVAPGWDPSSAWQGGTTWANH